MRSPWKSWLILGLLLGTMAYALAEDLTLVTYYPSPRGRYKEIIVDTLTLAPPGNLSVPGSLAVGPTYPPSGVPGQVNVEGGVHIGSSVALPPATKLAVQDGVVSLVNADVEMELNHGLWFDPGHTTGLWSRPGASNLTLVTGGADRVFLTDVGRVGIGTPTPAVPLHILFPPAAGDIEVVRFEKQGGNPLAYLKLTSTGDHWILGPHSAASMLTFGSTGFGSAFRVNVAGSQYIQGSVGIKTLPPASPTVLDLRGAIAVWGNNTCQPVGFKNTDTTLLWGTTVCPPGGWNKLESGGAGWYWNGAYYDDAHIIFCCPP